MSFMFASEREREMQQLKQRRMKHILSFNHQEIERKRNLKDQECRTVKTNSQIMNEEALNDLMVETRRREIQVEDRKDMLKASYDRQIRERRDRAKMERVRDREYLHRQEEYNDYSESRRMLDLAKIYNRGTFDAVPLDSRRRIQTEVKEGR